MKLALGLWILLLVGCSCVAANDDDLLSDTAERPADHIPIIVTKPEIIYMDIGGKAKLECKTEKLEPYILMWKKGTDLLTVGDNMLSTDGRIQLDGTNLVITNLTEKDVGEYTCEIRLNEGNVVAIKHSLLFKTSPRIYNPESKEVDLEVNEGERIELRCDASGSPLPTISWKIEEDFNLPPTTTGVIGAHGRTLEFKRIRQTDAGQYECLANNGMEEADRRVFRLRVLYKPKITIEKLLVPSGHSTNMELTCVVKAEPQAQVTWERNGVTITSGRGDNKRYHIKDGSSQHLLILRIHDFQDKDFGQYACVASNGLGKMKAVTEVEGVPSRVTFRSSPDGPDATFYDLRFETQSSTRIIDYRLLIRKETPDVNESRWEEVVIPAAQQSLPRYLQSFNVTGLAPASAYEAVVRARNGHGLSAQSDHFRFTTLGGSQRDDASKTPVTKEMEENGSSEIKSGLTNESGSGGNGNGNGVGQPQLDQRAKMVAVMTAVILIAFF